MSYMPPTPQGQFFYPLQPFNVQSQNIFCDNIDTNCLYESRPAVEPDVYVRRMRGQVQENKVGKERKRVGVACHRCRKRKIKCSGDPKDGTGCENCRQHQDLSQCNFVRVGTMYHYDVRVEEPRTFDNAEIGHGVKEREIQNTHDYRHADFSHMPKDVRSQPQTAIDPGTNMIVNDFNNLLYANSSAETRSMNPPSSSPLTYSQYSEEDHFKPFSSSVAESNKIGSNAHDTLAKARVLPAPDNRAQASPMTNVIDQPFLTGSNRQGLNTWLPPMADTNNMLGVQRSNHAAIASNSTNTTTSASVTSPMYMSMANTTRSSYTTLPSMSNFHDDQYLRRSHSYIGFNSQEPTRDSGYTVHHLTSEAYYPSYGERPVSPTPMDWQSIDEERKPTPPRRELGTHSVWDMIDRSNCQR